jgi:predicted transcriptional regulator
MGERYNIVQCMRDALKHACHECGMRFLSAVDTHEHEAETGHKLYATMQIDEALEGKAERFNPTINTLCRIMKALSEQNSINRTTLSTIANVHYSRLSKCLELLQERNYIELVIQNQVVNIRLTERGREFASKLSDLEI